MFFYKNRIEVWFKDKPEPIFIKMEDILVISADYFVTNSGKNFVKPDSIQVDLRKKSFIVWKDDERYIIPYDDIMTIS